MSAQIKITVNGASKEIASDQKPTHLFADQPDVVVCRINGELKDLWSDLVEGDAVESVLISSEDGLRPIKPHRPQLNHSINLLAHH